MANFKYSLSAPGQIGNINVKNFQYVFRQSAQIRVSYYLDISKFFDTKKFHGPKTQIWEYLFLGLKFFPDFWAQICQQHIFIIWQDGQTPHQSFFTNVSPNGHWESVDIWVPNRKNSLSVPGQIGNIVVKNFQHVFRQSAQIRMSYYLDIGNFFCTKKFYSPKTKFGKIIFWA